MSSARFLLPFILLALFLLAALTAAQPPDADDPEIILLPFKTYGLADDKAIGWIRLGPDSALDADRYAFFSLTSDAPIDQTTDLPALLTAYDLELADQTPDGHCAAKTLQKYGSDDLLCKPGVEQLPQGVAFLLLVDTDSLTIRAVTTSIDNRRGSAVAYQNRPQSTPAVQPPDQPADQPAPSADCGIYQRGDWIQIDDYRASGQDLPIRDLTDFTAVIHCAGNDADETYLEAWPKTRENDASANGSASDSQTTSASGSQTTSPSGSQTTSPAGSQTTSPSDSNRSLSECPPGRTCVRRWPSGDLEILD